MPLTLEPAACRWRPSRSASRAAPARSVTFDPVTISRRNYKGTVRLSDDALAADNAVHFVVSPSEPVRVTLVDRGGSATASTWRRRSRLATRRSSTSSRASPENLSDDDLRRSAARGAERHAGAGAARAPAAASSSSSGGGLLVAAGAARQLAADVDVLPAIDRQPRGPHPRRRRRAWAASSYGHPVFETFRAPRSGDFSSTRVYGYRNLGPVAGAQVLARFDAGAPAVLETPGGRRARADVGVLAGSDAGPTCRSARCSCRSCTARRPTWRPTSRRSRGSPSARCWIPRRPGAHKGQALPRVLLTPVGHAARPERRRHRGPRAGGAGVLRAARRRQRGRPWWPPTSTRPRPIPRRSTRPRCRRPPAGNPRRPLPRPTRRPRHPRAARKASGSGGICSLPEFCCWASIR